MAVARIRVIEKGKRGKKQGRRKRYDCERDKTEARGNGLVSDGPGWRKDQRQRTSRKVIALAHHPGGPSCSEVDIQGVPLPSALPCPRGIISSPLKASHAAPQITYMFFFYES